MYRARRIAWLLIAGYSILTCGSAFSLGDQPARLKKSPTGAVLRSMVVPGWGQVYTRSYWKAGAFAAVQGSLIAGVWWNENKVKDYIRAHDFVYEKFHRNQRNRLIWWLAGMTLLSMGDAYVDAQMYGLDWSPDISIHDGDVTTVLTLAVRF